MKKIFKKSMIALMVVLFSATLAMASGPHSYDNNYGGDHGAADCDGTGPHGK